MKKVLGILSFSFLISIPVILPFFHSGYFPTHDGEWTVVRLGDMFRTLRDFQIPARYSGNLNFGYGYPLFNFAYPFPYYVGMLIHSLGIGFVDSIKTLFAGSVFLSAFFMFFASRYLWKSTWAGIVSPILYIYFPYRMVDLYVRGSIGESFSFALFPLLFYLAFKLIDKPSLLLIGEIAVSISFLIMTHNIMTVLFMPVFIIFTLIQGILKNKKAIKAFLLSIFLGFGLAAFFWIPALFEKSNILLSQIPIADRNLYFVRLDQFLLPRWGYGVPTDPNGFSYQLGIPHLIILVLTIFILFRTYLKTRHSGLTGYRLVPVLSRIPPTAFLLIAILIFTFLLFKPSEFLWKNIPLLSEINYPWTVLGVLGFLVSLLGGFLCRENFGKYIYIMVFLGVVAVFSVLPYANPKHYINKGDGYYLTNDATTTSSNELMPLWVKTFPFQRPTKKVEIVEGKGKIENISYNSKKVTFDVLGEGDMKVRVNTIFYPGWNALAYPSWCHPELVSGSFTRFFASLRESQNDNDCKGKKLVIDYSNENGVMDIKIPSGSHSVEFVFTETLLRLLSDIVSLISILALLVMILVSSCKSLKIYQYILSRIRK